MDELKPTSTAEQTGGPEDEARREALKRFGRYAAAAPAAMLLLDPRKGHAGDKAYANPPDYINDLENSKNSGLKSGG